MKKLAPALLLALGGPVPDSATALVPEYEITVADAGSLKTTATRPQVFTSARSSVAWERASRIVTSLAPADRRAPTARIRVGRRDASAEPTMMERRPSRKAMTSASRGTWGMG